MNVIKSNFDCMQEQENFVLKSMKLKAVALKIFRFGPKMVLVVRRLIEQSQLLLKLFKTIFDMDQNWTRLWYVTELHNPDPCNWKVAPSLKSTAALHGNGKLPLVWIALHRRLQSKPLNADRQRWLRWSNGESWSGKCYGWTSRWSFLRILKMGIKPYAVQA